MQERLGERMKDFLEMMFHVYAAWKGDCHLYLDSFTSSRKKSNNLYRHWIKCGLIEEYEPVYPQSKSMYGFRNMADEEIKEVVQEKTKQVFVKSKKPSKSSYAITVITQKGIIFLAERNPDSVYFKYRKGETGRRFRVSDHDKLVRQLMISRSMIFMAAADVAVFSTQKPSMYRLYGNLSNGADGAYSEETDAELYPDYLKSDQQECLDLVNEKGVFYTNSEAKQFVDLIGGMDDSKSGRFETIRGSRCYGVYLSNKTAFLLYQEVPRSDKLIGVRHPFEERMHEAINDTFGEVMHYRQKVPYKNSVTDLYTAIISDGDSLVYSLSTRAKHGRIHYSNEELTDPDKRSQKIEKLANFSRINKILGSDSAKYPRVFVTPASFTGIISMNYLCHHTVEEYFQESSLVIKSRLDLFDPAKKMYDPFIFGWEKNTEHRVVNAIFIPVYEINLLRQLDIGSADEIELDGLAIITAPQMADCISHAIRRYAHYYDMASLNRIYIDNDTGAATSFSASDMKIITDLVTANRVCGYGEFWSKDQLAAVKQEPTLKNNLSLVISRYPISASNKKTLPRDVIQYNRSGIAMNGMDKYKKLRGEHSDEKKYRRPASARTEMQLSIRDKSKIKKAARILGISANELAVNASVVYADNIILASKGKGDIRKKKDPSVCPK